MSVDLPSGAVIEISISGEMAARSRGDRGAQDASGLVAISVRGQDGFTHLALLAISSRLPAADQTVPEIECRRGGLSEWKRAWGDGQRIQLRHR